MPDKPDETELVAELEQLRKRNLALEAELASVRTKDGNGMAQALARREAILESVAYVAERFLQTTESLAASMDAVLEKLGEATEVSRVYIFQNHMSDTGMLLMSQIYEWCAPGIEPQLDNPDLQNLSYEELSFVRWKTMLAQGELVYGIVRTFPPGEREILEPQSILSIVIVPIFVGQRWWGFIGFDDCLDERDWSPAEVDALRAAAGIIGSAMQQEQARLILLQSHSTLQEQYQERTSELDRTSKELYEKQILFQGILDNSPIAFYAKDRDGRFLLINQKASWLVHLSPKDVLGKTSSDLVPPEVAAYWSNLERQVFERGSIVETEDAVPLGNQIRYYMSSRFPIYNEKGEIYAVGGNFTDITDHRRLEEEIRKSEAQMRIFQTIIQNAPDAIIVCDMDGSITYTNPAHGTLFGYDTESIRGEKIHQFVGEEDLPRIPEILAFIKSRGWWRGPLLSKTKDGQVFPSEVSVTVIPGVTEHATILTAIVRDMSAHQRNQQERAALQQQIIEAQQMALRELSTPLIPISEHVLIMPLIGSMDDLRAQQMMETLLNGVEQYRARTVILDITGVSVMDTRVADALIRSAQAVKLLGAQVILTGIGPSMAQTLVSLGADLSSIITRSTLQSGVAFALKHHQ